MHQLFKVKQVKTRTLTTGKRGRVSARWKDEDEWTNKMIPAADTIDCHITLLGMKHRWISGEWDLKSNFDRISRHFTGAKFMIRLDNNKIVEFEGYEKLYPEIAQKKKNGKYKQESFFQLAFPKETFLKLFESSLVRISANNQAKVEFNEKIHLLNQSLVVPVATTLIPRGNTRLFGETDTETNAEIEVGNIKYDVVVKVRGTYEFDSKTGFLLRKCVYNSIQGVVPGFPSKDNIMEELTDLTVTKK
ncbi:MAG: hypothetical protein EOP53_21430 [Sphingobacteriales bacterium]|nr:MAG: hypothetical protein EOP53_21430 [Sphingobacteriales bacterium]